MFLGRPRDLRAIAVYLVSALLTLMMNAIYYTAYGWETEGPC